MRACPYRLAEGMVAYSLICLILLVIDLFLWLGVWSGVDLWLSPDQEGVRGGLLGDSGEY